MQGYKIMRFLKPREVYTFDFTGKKSISSSIGSGEGPLHGVRIIDLTRILAGPFCTMILGDLGAEIIKVEKPGSGDDTRAWISRKVNFPYFISVNRNKKSIAIDLKKGSSIIYELVKRSDVIVENFIPGTMEKLGLGYETLSALNPRLIYGSITGYGSSGPYVRRGGYDVIASSIGGLMHITGPKNGPPCKTGVALTDIATGLYLHGAIMAALIQRSSTGKGQRIDTNLLSTQISCLTHLASDYLNGGIDASRWGTAHESIVPYQSFKTKDDRWITIGTGNNDLFHQLCDRIDAPHLKEQKKYSTNSDRVTNREELIDFISNVIVQKTCEYWMEKFEGSKFPYGPVNDFKNAFEDPQIKHNQIVQSLGEYKVVGPAVTFSSGGNFARFSAPSLGQHTREVLKSIAQLDDIEIDELFKSEVVA